MLAWTMAAELPTVPLADGLELAAARERRRAGEIRSGRAPLACGHPLERGGSGRWPSSLPLPNLLGVATFQRTAGAGNPRDTRASQRATRALQGRPGNRPPRSLYPRPALVVPAATHASVPNLDAPAGLIGTSLPVLILDAESRGDHGSMNAAWPDPAAAASAPPAALPCGAARGRGRPPPARGVVPDLLEPAPGRSSSPPDAGRVTASAQPLL
jgi:hypothetical protein